MHTEKQKIFNDYAKKIDPSSIQMGTEKLEIDDWQDLLLAFRYTKVSLPDVTRIIYEACDSVQKAHQERIATEIEHNGERFVPILKICDFLGFKYSQYTLLDNSVDLVLDSNYHRANTKTKEPQKVRFWFSNHKGISFYCTNMNLLMYKDIFGAIQKLLEWHFNVFNLSEDEYIDKSKLKTENNGK